ncbi:MAG: hypothetical protein ACODAE_00070 [Gemmatimonadota bacterium]
MRLASRGQRDMDAGPETITDAAELARVRRQARRVHVNSLAWAALLSALVVAVPR